MIENLEVEDGGKEKPRRSNRLKKMFFYLITTFVLLLFTTAAEIQSSSNLIINFTSEDNNINWTVVGNPVVNANISVNALVPNSTYARGVNCADIVGTADNVCVDASGATAENVTGNSTFANQAKNSTYSAGINCADISGTTDNVCADTDTVYNDAALTVNDTAYQLNLTQHQGNISRIVSEGNLTGKSAGGDLSGTYPNPLLNYAAVVAPMIINDTTAFGRIQSVNNTKLNVTGGNLYGGNQTVFGNLTLVFASGSTGANIYANSSGCLFIFGGRDGSMNVVC